MTPDPFGTRALRDAVLATWSATPTRLREDANAEEDHARGYYRDRVVVELAQNAADAATRAGEAGHLLLRLTEVDGRPVLLAANTGAPIDAAGVASLASLRASAKRGDAGTVGRFGVGFAAVRSVADDVAVDSVTGGVHFSLARTLEGLDRLGPAVAAEVTRRQGSLPALRLPFDGAGPLAAATGPLLGTWSTVVALGLRDDEAVTLVRAQLDAVGDALLIALPGLASVVVEVDGTSRRVEDVTGRWVVASRAGTLPTAVLADRPVEETERPAWQVTWAVPRHGSGASVPATVHAPTPTDEPSTVPALLIATFPLDPSRRHVAPGPATDLLVAHAAATWADLLAACRAPGGPEPLDLVPTGLPAGALDAALREAVLATTRTVPVLTPVDGGPALTAEQAVMLAGPPGRDPAVLSAVAAWLPDLVAVTHRAQGRALGIREVELAEVVDAMPALAPERLRELLDAFSGADRSVLEQVATVPVPLLDGRTVRGARGLTMVDGLDERLGRTLAGWGLRLVHPRAAHAVLERLGVERIDPRGLLRHPTVRARVLADDPDDEDLDDDRDLAGTDLDGVDGVGPPGHLPPGRISSDDGLRPTARVVLGLVDAALATGPAPEPEPWWGELLLPAEDGEQVPAHGLVLPGSQAARWFDPEVLPPLAPAVAERLGAAATLVGVRTAPVVEHLPAGWAETDPDEEDALSLLTDRLDGWADYLDHLDEGSAHRPDGAVDRTGTTVVADLDAVRPEAWPEVLVALGRGELRRAVLDGPAAGRLPSYTAWWLRHRSDLGLARPFALPGAGTSRVGRLLGPVPVALEGLLGALDDEVLGALGGTGGADDLAHLPALLEALPAAGTVVDLALAVEIWSALGRASARGGTLESDRLPALLADRSVAMVETARAVVATPLWAQLTACAPVLVTDRATAPALAELLDLDLAEEVAPGEIAARGEQVPVPTVVHEVYPRAPRTWVEHEELMVDGEAVTWWVEPGPEGPDGPVVHAATTRGLAQGLAWALDLPVVDRLERLLAAPDLVGDVLLDLAGDPAAIRP